VSLGSVLSYVTKGIELGYAIVVTNPNAFLWFRGRVRVNWPQTTEPYSIIQGSDNPEKHLESVFKVIFEKNKDSFIYAVAVQHNGLRLLHVLDEQPEYRKRVAAIAFATSCHNAIFFRDEMLHPWLKENTLQWSPVSHFLNVDEPSLEEQHKCPCMSVGLADEDNLVCAIQPQVFRFFEAKDCGLTTSEIKEEVEGSKVTSAA